VHLYVHVPSMNAVMSAYTIMNGSVQEGQLYFKSAFLKAMQSAHVCMDTDDQAAADEQAPVCSKRCHNVS